MKALRYVGVLFICATVMGAAARSNKEAVVSKELMYAIRMVESSGDDNCPDGDGGKAIGPFQIHRGYWQDATEYDKEIGGTYEDCRRRDYAERIVRAYMQRYAPAKATDERIARLHNGGCGGWRSEAAGKYWEKVKKYL